MKKTRKTNKKKNNRHNDDIPESVSVSKPKTTSRSKTVEDTGINTTSEYILVLVLVSFFGYGIIRFILDVVELISGKPG